MPKPSLAVGIPVLNVHEFSVNGVEVSAGDEGKHEIAIKTMMKSMGVVLFIVYPPI
jgi:hypothetical protein